jgi:hypothetical protein
MRGCPDGSLTNEALSDGEATLPTVAESASGKHVVPIDAIRAPCDGASG